MSISPKSYRCPSLESVSEEGEEQEREDFEGDSEEGQALLDLHDFERGVSWFKKSETRFADDIRLYEDLSKFESNVSRASDVLEKLMLLHDQVFETQPSKMVAQFGVVGSLGWVSLLWFWLLSTWASVLVDLDPNRLIPRDSSERFEGLHDATSPESTRDYEEVAMLGNVATSILMCLCVPCLLTILTQRVVSAAGNTLGIAVLLILVNSLVAGAAVAGWDAVSTEDTVWISQMNIMLTLFVGRLIDLWSIVYFLSRMAKLAGFGRNRMLVAVTVFSCFLLVACLSAWMISLWLGSAFMTMYSLCVSINSVLLVTYQMIPLVSSLIVVGYGISVFMNITSTRSSPLFI